jgi:hypothetical protein
LGFLGHELLGPLLGRGELGGRGGRLRGGGFGGFEVAVKPGGAGGEGVGGFVELEPDFLGLAAGGDEFAPGLGEVALELVELCGIDDGRLRRDFGEAFFEGGFFGDELGDAGFGLGEGGGDGAH